MKSSKKGKANRISNNRPGMAAIAIVAFILLGVTYKESKSLENRVAYYNARAASLEESIEEEKARTEEIEEKKKYMETDAYVEEVARNRLGLVKDHEIVFEEKK